MNTQPIMKRDSGDGTFLLVHSIFHTIQGEGPFAGRSAVFIRLGGCNLQCPRCDTEYMNGAATTDYLDIVDKVCSLADAPELVVITGGEPLRQDLSPLIVELLEVGYTVQLETNGTLPLSLGLQDSVELDPRICNRLFIVCSPKAGKVNRELEPFICAYKYVLTAGKVREEDGLPLTALDHTATPYVARPYQDFIGTIYVQPCDNKNPQQNADNLSACIESVKTFGYTLQLQIHKLLGVE